MITHIQDHELLNADEIIARLKHALDTNIPYSFIRIGDGENFVLAQDSVYTLNQLLAEQWPRLANEGRKGIKFPNIEMRDQMITAIKESDLVGVLAQNDNIIRAHPTHKRHLTNQIFNYFQLQPKAICNAVVNRELLVKNSFWDLLKGRRLLLISKWAGGLKQRLILPPYQLTVAGTIRFERYEQMNETLKQIESLQDQFDIALISCGVNAVVLAHQVARLTGKVGVDFGICSQIVSMRKIK